MRVLGPIILLVLAYLVSVPLFGYKYGVNAQGHVTDIVTKEDAAPCEAEYAKLEKKWWDEEQAAQIEYEKEWEEARKRKPVAPSQYVGAWPMTDRSNAPTAPVPPVQVARPQSWCGLADPKTVRYDWFYGLKYINGFLYRVLQPKPKPS